MDVIIENEKLRVKTNTHGAEMISIISKKTNQEYLWKGVPFWWKIFCPTLFPIIGKVKHFEYRYEGNEYFMPEHGFSSRARHTLVSNSTNEVEFELINNEEINEIYPFKFSLKTKYTLNDNRIAISFVVDNLDDKDIYFSIGSHPAFKCPMYGKDDKLDDYYLKFEKSEKATKKEINKNDFLTGNDISFLDNEDTISLSQETFKEGTIILKDLKSKYIELGSHKHDRNIKLNFERFNTLSIWAPDRDARFICIEPWMGHADYEDFEGEIKDKEGIITLKSGKSFEIGYSIEFN